MPHGVYVDYKRPKSKKQVKEAILDNPSRVRLESVSFFGNEYDGPVADMPSGKVITFVGPDPHTSRKFFGQIARSGDTFKVS